MAQRGAIWGLTVFMIFLDRILGRRLKTADQEQHRVKVWEGIPMLGLDALGSSAYGPEAALTVLIPAGLAASRLQLPIVLIITGLLIIVAISYRQTIAAYPNGGGSYTVASENLGKKVGVVAAAALMLDYILNSAVGISAGVGALVSAVPSLHPHILPICLGILTLLTLINLRGAKESGILLAFPTYLFVLCMFAVLGWGVFKTISHGGHPHPVVPLPRPQNQALAPTLWWLLIRAFASGCTAMTGVEAVSNGVQAFAEPRVKQAQRTLTLLVAFLGVMLVGIAILTRSYGVVATDPNDPHYQSVVSQIAGAVSGKGVLYYCTIATSLAVLALSANTSFAGFPRLCRLVALDDFLPHAFTMLGRRLVYSSGILVLAGLSAIILTLFGGVTDRLIPLFAVGALLAFTLSQAGMVRHHARSDSPARHKQALNLVGAICTGAALVIVLVAKFTEGAWLSVLIVGATIALFFSIKKHYEYLAKVLVCDDELCVDPLPKPIAIVPVTEWNMVTSNALQFALSISDDVRALHVSLDEDEEKRAKEHWESHVQGPIKALNLKVPGLTVVRSPYRRFLGPMLATLVRIRKDEPERVIAVVVPELVEERWYQYFLHSQRASLIKFVLLLKGGNRIVVMSVPWHIKQSSKAKDLDSEKSAKS